MASQLYVKGSASGAKAQNVEWFATDIAGPVNVGKAQDLIIDIECSTTVQATGDIEYTLDSGSAWLKLGDGSLAINVGTRFRTIIKTGDTFNMRSVNAAGITIDRCDVIADQDA